MIYTAYKTFDGKAACGFINIPKGKPLSVFQDFLIYNGKPICAVTSENAHVYFMRNDDGKGMARGELIETIQAALRKDPSKWEAIWNDPFCKKYKHPQHEDVWLWNHDFYNAPIEDLRYIANLVVTQ